MIMIFYAGMGGKYDKVYNRLRIKYSLTYGE